MKLFLLFSLVAVQTAFANQEALMTPAETQEVVESPFHGRQWHFIGCTHDDHECHDLAHDYGYSRTRTVHGSNLCHHGDETHACYAK